MKSNKPFFLEITMIYREKSERRDQSLFFFKNINFWKSLPRVPEFEYPPLVTHTMYNTIRTVLH